MPSSTGPRTVRPSSRSIVNRSIVRRVAGAAGQRERRRADQGRGRSQGLSRCRRGPTSIRSASRYNAARRHAPARRHAAWPALPRGWALQVVRSRSWTWSTWSGAPGRRAPAPMASPTATALHRAWNCLEDQRMETAVVSDAPRKAAFFTPMVMTEHMKTLDFMAANYPLLVWRRYLPSKLRARGPSAVHRAPRRAGRALRPRPRPRRHQVRHGHRRRRRCGRPCASTTCCCRT